MPDNRNSPGMPLVQNPTPLRRRDMAGYGNADLESTYHTWKRGMNEIESATKGTS
ncbi:hypothetical protein YTPLAS18_17380 [Nitrospira sp.]|nr:hypothetical protein YTPLAS18_17380 [Nitrospira sp.]